MERRGKNLLVSPAVPPPDPAIATALRPYQNVRRATFCGFDDRRERSDGVGRQGGGSAGVFVLTRFAESDQVHHVRSSMGMRGQLTFCDEPVKECYPAPAAFRAALNEARRDTDEVAGQASGTKEESRGANDGPLFVYSQDEGGDENTQYHLYLSGGVQTRLDFDDQSLEMQSKRSKTDERKVMHRSWTWNHTDGSAAFVSNARDGTLFDLYVASANCIADLAVGGKVGEDVARRVLTNTEPGYLVIKDFVGRHLLVQHYTSVTDSRLFLIMLSEEFGSVCDKREIGGGGRGSGHVSSSVESNRGDSKPPQASVGGSARLVFNDDERLVGVLFSSDRGEGKEFRSLRFWVAGVDEEVGRDLEVLEGQIPWNVTDLLVRSSTRDVIIGFNEDGSSSYYHGQFSGGNDEDAVVVGLRSSLSKLVLPGLELGVALGQTELLNEAGTRLFGFSFATPVRPPDVYVYNLSSRTLTAWTESEIGGLDSREFRLPQLIRYKSFDGRDIPAFVYQPPKQKKGNEANPRPVVIHPHGGPEGQHRPAFNAFYQFLLLELGVAIIDPNVRGSSGYGKTFVSLDNGYNREDSVKDIGALINWVASYGYSQNPPLDKTRIAVWGGSYGGYMCLASLIHFPDRLVCGVDMVGISHFVTFLEKTAPYRRDLRREKYGDERDTNMREFLHSISPLTNADQIVSPLLIAQGKNDPRVPVGEAQQIYDTMHSKGAIEAWFLVAEDEGHGFRKKSNVDAYQDAMVQFFRKFLFA